MAIFCRHPKSVIVAKSNVIQFDQSGFPMRLETMECLSIMLGIILRKVNLMN